MQEYIKKLQQEIQSKQQELDLAKKLLTQFPDLNLNINRWGTKRYSSASVNAIVMDFEARHNCGCCPDSPLEIWPYLEFNGVRIYSDPTGFGVGKKSWGGYDTPNPNWRETLTKVNIPAGIIDRINLLLKSEEVEEDDDLPCLGGCEGGEVNHG